MLGIVLNMNRLYFDTWTLSDRSRLPKLSAATAFSSGTSSSPVSGASPPRFEAYDSWNQGLVVSAPPLTAVLNMANLLLALELPHKGQAGVTHQAKEYLEFSPGRTVHT